MIANCKQCGKEYKKEWGNKGFCGLACYWAWTKDGHSISYWKGKKRSAEDREKFRKSHIGLTYPNRKSPAFWNPDNTFKKGFIPWNKGIKMSKEHCDNVKNGMKHLSFKKEKNPAWKGGVTPLHQRVRKSEEYKNWRTKVFERDNYTCRWCFKRGCWIEAHHIYPLKNYAHIVYFVPNGITLCRSCHSKIKSKEEDSINIFCGMNGWPLRGNPRYSVPKVSILEISHLL